MRSRPLICVDLFFQLLHLVLKIANFMHTFLIVAALLVTYLKALLLLLLLPCVPLHEVGTNGELLKHILNRSDAGDLALNLRTDVLAALNRHCVLYDGGKVTEG